MNRESDSSKRIFAINPDLQKQVSPILTNMVSTLLKKKPQDPVSRLRSAVAHNLTLFVISVDRFPTWSSSWRSCKVSPHQLCPLTSSLSSSSCAASMRDLRR